MSKEQKITGNIQPPNKDLEILKQNFPSCFDKNGAFDFEKFKTQLSKNEINFSKESYGMDWLGKSYARLLATDEATTLLKEDETFNQKEENAPSENLLIKGDNLEVLKHLSNAYYEKVKMIYIDPPYNTGSDGFVYADDRKFDVPTLMELSGVNEERARRILDFTQSKSNSHSAWLTFMYPRLYIAKQLLKDDGVIFISIDDNEVAQLRLLMDEIFGEENFLNQIAWRKSDNQANIGQLARVKEYIIGYTKIRDKALINKVPLTDKAKKEYSYKDEKGKFRRGILFHKTRGRHFYNVTTKNGKTLKGPWMIKEDVFKELDKNNKILWTSSGEEQPYSKIYLKDSKGQIANDFWDTKYGSNQKASLKLEELFGKRIFDFPKSTILVNTLITLGANSNDLILDFFAGSGTTGDAVMQLNAEDAGNRKFILVQLPELIDPKSNKTAYDFVQHELKVETPTIFEITKERLIRAARKINAELDEKTKSLALKIKNLQAELQTDQTKADIKDLQNLITKNSKLKTQNSFKIFETTPIWEDYNFEAEELATQTHLFDERKLTQEDLKALVVTWKTYDGVPLTETVQETDLNGYIAQYTSEKLYLMDKGFKTINLKILLEKIDSDTNFNPTIIIAFGYHFESKNLREISENLKSYANKKSIDIDFITRY